MDIDVVITKATALLQQAQNYKALLSQKSDIQTQTQGVITINGESKQIDGRGLTMIKGEWLSELESTATASNAAMDTLCDEIIVELAS